MVSVRKNHAPDRDHVLVADGVADDGERIQPGLAMVDVTFPASS
jgi:hypothetical protein